MPYEIDYALLSYAQLKKSRYHIPDDVEIEIDTVMNCSNYLIDWDKSKLPKEVYLFSKIRGYLLQPDLLKKFNIL